MPSFPNDLVLPRPKDGAPQPPKKTMPAPPEKNFTDTFGVMLPPVKYLTVNDAQVAYYEWLPHTPVPAGTTTPTPDRILILHGVQTPSLGMLPLARTLKPYFPHATFVFLDLYGHALTDTPIVPHTPELFYKLIDAVLDHLAWPTAHFLGFSLGGMLSVGYAATRSSRVKSMALIGPGGLLRISDLSQEQQAFMRGGDDLGARKWVFEFLEGGSSDIVVPADWQDRVSKGEVVAEAVRDWQVREHPGHAASVVAMVRDGGAFDNSEAYVEAAKKGIPSIVVLGEHDGMCTEDDLKKVGFNNVVIVPATGHVVVREKAVEAGKAVADFWKGLSK